MYKLMRIEIRVIFALLMREIITRYGRHGLGFLWLFVEPMMFTLGIIAFWSFAGVGHGHLPIVPFAITGYSSVLMWRNMPGRTALSIEPNLSLLFHKNVKVIDIFISRTLLEAAGASASFLVLSLLFGAFGMVRFPEDLLKVLLGWVLLAWFGMALAMIIGALTHLSEFVEKIWHPLTYIIFPLAGAAFMVSWIPPLGQKVALFFPMVHCLELIREGYFGSYVSAHYSVEYMLFSNLILTFIGLLLTLHVSRNLIPE